MRSYTHSRPSFVFVAILLAAPCWSLADDVAGWKSLFNGKDMSGWTVIDGPPTAWHVNDGLLSCGGGGDGKGWLSTTDQYKNFELELEFRLPPGGNSGIFLRAPHTGNPAYEGMEIQALDDDSPQYSKIEPWQHCGSLYGLAPAKLGALKKAGEWQKYDIVCDGQRVKVTLNGTLVIDANLADFQDERLDNKSHPGINRAEGFVGLQNHGSPVDFRNIRIRALP